MSWSSKWNGGRIFRSSYKKNIDRETKLTDRISFRYGRIVDHELDLTSGQLMSFMKKVIWDYESSVHWSKSWRRRASDLRTLRSRWGRSDEDASWRHDDEPFHRQIDACFGNETAWKEDGARTLCCRQRSESNDRLSQTAGALTDILVTVSRYLHSSLTRTGSCR